MTDEDNSNNRYGWWGGLACGLVVILVGVVFLLRNLGIPLPFLGLHNWWALFIVVGAVPLLAQTADSYRKAGRIIRRCCIHCFQRWRCCWWRRSSCWNWIGEFGGRCS